MDFFCVMRYSFAGVFFCTWWHGLLAGLPLAGKQDHYYEASKPWTWVI